MALLWQSYIDYMLDRGSIENIMIISGKDGALWATSSEQFLLKEYKTLITQEDGSEVNELVNETENILKLIGKKPCSQGLRINGTKKQQITRQFDHENTGLPVIYSKFSQGGSCIASAEKCILIATYNESKGHTSPDCNETITLMAMYLAKSVWPQGTIATADGSAEQIAKASGPASWQAYIDTCLIGKGNVAQAILFNTVDGTILASSNADFKVEIFLCFML